MRILKLMADYDCFPIWEASPGEVGNINPDELPISNELKRRLADWAVAYNVTLDSDYPPDSGFDDDNDELTFKIEAMKIAACLRDELGGDYSVIVQVWSDF